MGSLDGKVYAINPDGTQQGAFQTGGEVRSSPAIGSDGTVYVGSNDDKVYAINPDGTQQWAFQTGGGVESSPAIGSDGTVYVGSYDGKVYNISGFSGGLAQAPWPMFRHDLGHSGRSGDDRSCGSGHGLTTLSEMKLTASDGTAGDAFGYSVATSGDIAIIGAGLDDHAGLHSGSAYVFRYDGTEWVKDTKLVASDAEWGSDFGESVAISGDTAVIGARGDSEPGEGGMTGAAYVFRYDGSAWVETKLTASDPMKDAVFGYSVAISGDTAVVGSPGSVGNTGAAYVFRYDGSAWVETKLTPSDGTAHRFGESVAISGDTAVIGAYNAAYVFRYNEGTWIETKLTASDGPGGGFGYSVAISGDKVVIGSAWDDDLGDSSGSAYVFRFDGSAWIEVAKLAASDGETYDSFGYSVTISGDTVIVGAAWDDASDEDSGSAYVYELAACTPSGDGVVTQPLDRTTGTYPVTLTFSQVTQAGTTKLTTSGTGPITPSGFQLGTPPTYFDLTTTAVFWGSVTVCIDYSKISFPGAEADLELLHHESGTWVKDPFQSLDTANKIICGTFSSLSPFGIFVKSEPQSPITTNLAAAPNPVAVGTNITLTATVDDSQTGGSKIRSAECIVDGNIYGNMNAQDGVFDSETEDVTANIQPFGEAGLHIVCVYGTDSSGNVAGVDDCLFLPVYDPTGGFVTGGGWINSPAGAYMADPSLTGKANFGFVSKYKKGADAPIGQTEFQFQVADLNFHSDSYEWLVVTNGGTFAKFKGEGKINGDNDENGNPVKFLIWAEDSEPDTFRIKIWMEDEWGNETVVYDNGFAQVISGGSIVIHTKK
jgi:hypothetical protein